MNSDSDCGSDAGAEWVWVRRPSEAVAVAAAAGWPADEETRPLRVVFGSPAKYFTDAAPIGNGRLGAMVWGGVESERLQLNRKPRVPPLPLHPCSWIVLGCFAPLLKISSRREKKLWFFEVDFFALYLAVDRLIWREMGFL